MRSFISFHVLSRFCNVLYSCMVSILLTMSNTDVLIIGAGPSGLVLALWLTRQGVDVRIIDKTELIPSTSRALAVHARTLELYRQLDLAEDVVANGHKVEATNIWSEGTHKAHIPLGDIGHGLTPYPFVHIYPQDRHEKLLEEKLNELGVNVERNRELVEFTQHDSHVTVRVKDGTSLDNSLVTYEASFIAGCDGSHSAVRHISDINFEGAAYEHLFYVSDIEGSGPVLNGQANLSFSKSEFALTFPYDEGHRARLVGAVDEQALTKEQSELTLEDVAPRTINTMELHIDKVNWFATYKIHHRVAETFRKGRAFLVGDAAHIHSPVGGQGMNTGIGDAINLAWKLSAVVKAKADLALLDSYEAERRAFACTLVATTDRAFNAIISKGYISHFIRAWFFPYIMPYLVQFNFFRHGAFRGMSQIMLNYRESFLSAGSAGDVHGGDRIPWVPVEEVDNFESLKAITWQIHVYGSVKEELTEWCRSKGIPLHVFPWNEKYQAVGLGRDAAYLVRPDTYVAVAEPSGLPQDFEEHLKGVNIRVD